MEEEIGISIESAFELNEANNNAISSEKQRFKRDLIKKESIYLKLISQLETKLNAIQTKVYLDFINQMINFVDECQLRFEDQNDKFKLYYVQTGIISISCSATEYDFIFDLFISKLDERNFRNFVFVSSNEKVTLENIIGQIFRKVFTDDLLNKEIKIENTKKFMQMLKFKQFVNIYKKHFDTEPIILIIDDLISMDCKTINKLFELLHSNLDKLPIVVFCGLSQASVSLQSLLTPKILNKICITSFTTKKTFHILDEVFHSTFIDSDLDLKFGSQCLTHFLDTFTYYDFSIKKIEHLAKLAIWDFCYSNKYAYLNGSLKNFVSKLNNLNSNELDELMNIESLKNYEFEVKKPKEVLITLFKRMKEIQFIFLSELKALYELIKTTSINFSFRDLYLTFLSNHINMKSKLEQLLNVIREYEPDEWTIQIQSLMGNDLVNQTKLVKLLEEQLEKINDLDLRVIEEKKESIKSPKNMSRNEFLKYNLERVKNVKKKTNLPFNNWKRETIELIKDNYIELENPSCSYLNELFYYDNVDVLKNLNLVSYREQIIKYLVSPEEFVRIIQKQQSAKNQKVDDKITNFQPEICLAFKLYRESQLKINLADWLQTYIDILSQQEIEQSLKNSKSPRKKTKIQSTDDLTSKFFSNLADLEYLGILEKTNKSSDYVTKLIL